PNSLRCPPCHIRLHIRILQAETSTQRRIVILRVNWARQLFDQHHFVKLVEVSDLAPRKVAKPRRFAHLRPGLELDVLIQWTGPHRQSQCLAARTVSSAVRFRLADEGFVHRSSFPRTKSMSVEASGSFLKKSLPRLCYTAFGSMSPSRQGSTA